MAKRAADGAAKKPYSSKLLQMKFMQRGNKAKAAETPMQAEDAKEVKEGQGTDEEQWVPDSRLEMGCQVIFEGDPAPGASSGRITFSGVAASEAPLDSVPQQAKDAPQEQENPMPAPVEPEKSIQQQPAPKKRKNAAAAKEERFDSPKVDTKGRYFLS